MYRVLRAAEERAVVNASVSLILPVGSKQSWLLQKCRNSRSIRYDSDSFIQRLFGFSKLGNFPNLLLKRLASFRPKIAKKVDYDDIK